MPKKKYLIALFIAVFVLLIALVLIFKPKSLNKSDLNSTQQMQTNTPQKEPLKPEIKGLFADFNQSQNTSNQYPFNENLNQTSNNSNENSTINSKENPKTAAQNVASNELHLSLNINENLDLNKTQKSILEQTTHLEPENKALDENLSAQNASNLNLNLEQNLSLEKNAQELNISNLNAKNDENTSLLDENLSTKNSFFVKQITKDKNAKLALIIDDVASSAQVRQIKALNLKITPSFFPADINHPNTPKLAREFDFFMLHLPLEAKNFKKEELKTLRASDSFEEIDKFLSKIKRDFKGLVFINNHTGSAFTSNLAAMRRLLASFEKHGFIFVDSLTAGSSKGVLVMRERGQTPIVRDIFLDNSDNVEAIKKQLLKAVNLAKKKGFAIAIAHPRKNTFKALAQSKELLQSVELVYLNEVFAKSSIK